MRVLLNNDEFESLEFFIGETKKEYEVPTEEVMKYMNNWLSKKDIEDIVYLKPKIIVFVNATKRY